MKIFNLKNLRRLRRILSVLLPVLFTAFFSGFILHSDFLLQSTEWQFFPALLASVTLGGAVAIAVILIFALLTMFCGRLYCSWFCPLGMLQEFIERLNNRFFHRKERSYKPGHGILRTAVFVFAAAMLICNTALFIGYIEPYSLFGKFSSGIVRQCLNWINSSTVALPQSAIEATAAWSAALAVSGGFLLALILLVVFKGRIFCNTICPAGTLMAALAAKSSRRLTIDQDKCVKCGKCEKACNAHCIDIKGGQKIDFSRCFMCLECMEACPVKAIKMVKRRSGGMQSADLPASPERRNMLIAAGAAGAMGAAAGVIGKKSSSQSQAIVPPGAGSLDEFLSRCTGCGLCIANCRGDCLQPALTEYGWRGFMLPVMKFSGTHPGKCEYECNNCTANCPTGALKYLTLPEKKLCRIGMAQFYPKNCVAYADGEPCGACAEHCPTGALKMVAGPHKFATVPQVISDLCIGCGNCQYACPVTPQAVRVNPIEKQTRAVDPEVYRKKEEVKKAPSSIPF